MAGKSEKLLSHERVKTSVDLQVEESRERDDASVGEVLLFYE